MSERFQGMIEREPLRFEVYEKYFMLLKAWKEEEAKKTKIL